MSYEFQTFLISLATCFLPVLILEITMRRQRRQNVIDRARGEL